MAIPARLLRDDEDAGKLLDGLGSEPAGKTPEELAEENRVADEAKRKADEAEAAKRAASPPTDDSAALKAEVTRLTQLLNDANNPTWQQRYNSLQGMFNRQNEEVKAIKTEMEELKKKPAPQPAAPVSGMTDDDYKSLVEEVGEPAAKIQKKIADENAQLRADLAAQKEEVAAIKGEAKTAAEKAAEIEHRSQQQTAQERFFSDLTAKVPEWKTLNGWDNTPQNPKFTEFLSLGAPGTGKTYDDLLNAHYADGNVQAVAEIFDLGKKHAGAVSATTTDDLPPIEPGKTGHGAPPPKPQTKKTYTKAQHDKLMRDVTLPGRFRGTEAERKALEDDLIDAELEGRVK